MIKQILGRLPKKPFKMADSSVFAGSKGEDDSANYNSSNGKDLSHPVVYVPTNSSLIYGNKLTQMEDSKAVDNMGVDFIEALPSFRDIPSSDRHDLLMRKLRLCYAVFDFTDPTKNVKEKEIKRQTLLELVDYVSSANEKFNENIVQEFIKMVSANLFRLPNGHPRENKSSKAHDYEEEEPLMDPAWPHLQIVYELFLRFVASPETDTKLAKRYIDHGFLVKLLDLFDSEDPRERDFLKKLLHRVYGKLMVHRPFIRKSINNIFYRFTFETEKFNGVAELLEVLGSVISGFALPLKEEHKLFLVRVLMPLHKPKCLPIYHQQLLFCIMQFVEKDVKLAYSVLMGLLKYWPVTNSSKEVMFLGELEEVLELTQMPDFQRCIVPLFRRIGRCLSSSHFQVAERALYLWSNDTIEFMIRQCRKSVLPIILPALEKNSCTHWNKAVQNLTLNVRKTFSDGDPELFEECLRKYHEDEAKLQEFKARQEGNWRRLQEIS